MPQLMGLHCFAVIGESLAETGEAVVPFNPVSNGRLDAAFASDASVLFLSTLLALIRHTQPLLLLMWPCSLIRRQRQQSSVIKASARLQIPAHEMGLSWNTANSDSGKGFMLFSRHNSQRLSYFLWQIKTKCNKTRLNIKKQTNYYYWNRT